MAFGAITRQAVTSLACATGQPSGDSSQEASLRGGRQGLITAMFGLPKRPETDRITDGDTALV
jgi:hypothetical protein